LPGGIFPIAQIENHSQKGWLDFDPKRVFHLSQRSQGLEVFDCAFFRNNLLCVLCVLELPKRAGVRSKAITHLPAQQGFDQPRANPVEDLKYLRRE